MVEPLVDLMVDHSVASMVHVKVDSMAERLVQLMID